MVEAQVAPVQTLRQLGQQLRVDSIRCTTAAGSGHPTSSMSAADLMAVLLGKYLRYDFDEPKAANNDRLVFSKGHASPLLYSMFKAAGAISDDELLSLRKFGSRLEGHPVPVLPWVDVATGSLGQGLPIGVGMAIAGKRLNRLPFRVWVICGDSEMAEGSMWRQGLSARVFLLAWEWRSTASISTSCPIAFGSSTATVRWRKAPCGNHLSLPGTTSWTI